MLVELAIYEHKAALIGKTPTAVSRNPDLLVAACLKEWQTYGADYLTVGLDIYNLEVEACGAQLKCQEANGCPEVTAPLYKITALPDAFPYVDVSRDGRFPLIVTASKQVVARVAGQVQVRVGVSGPVSMAAKLVGIEDLLAGLFLHPTETKRLLGFCLGLAKAWVAYLVQQGLQVIVFDSTAAPPLLSPAHYREFVAPLHAELMQVLQSAGQKERPLIIGGDTSAILTEMYAVGVNSVICDYNADVEKFAQVAGSLPGLIVRRNINPQSLLADEAAAVFAAQQLKQELKLFAQPVAGTGILPYATKPENVLAYVRALRT